MYTSHHLKDASTGNVDVLSRLLIPPTGAARHGYNRITIPDYVRGLYNVLVWVGYCPPTRAKLCEATLCPPKISRIFVRTSSE